jgi:hypothetical protein
MREHHLQDKASLHARASSVLTLTIYCAQNPNNPAAGEKFQELLAAYVRPSRLFRARRLTARAATRP